MRLILLSLGIVVALGIIFTCINAKTTNKPFLQDTLLKDSLSISKLPITEIEDTLLPNKKSSVRKPKSTKKTTSTIKDDTTKHYIYLTFDDGPDIGTPIVANILKEENVPGTFFIIGWHVIKKGIKLRQYFQDTLLNNPFFLCANHSFTHAYFNKYPKFYNDLNGGIEDFIRNQDTCKFKNKIIRAPGSNVWWTQKIKRKERTYYKRELIMDSLIKLGYIVVGWDLEWKFTKKQGLKESTQEMLQAVYSFFENSHSNSSRNHLILLMHDRTVAHPNDADSLRTFIKILKEHKNYEFRLLTDYPMVRTAMKEAN